MQGVGYADFNRIVQKGAVVTLVISGVTGPILTHTMWLNIVNEHI